MSKTEELKEWELEAKKLPENVINGLIALMSLIVQDGYAAGVQGASDYPEAYVTKAMNGAVFLGDLSRAFADRTLSIVSQAWESARKLGAMDAARVQAVAQAPVVSQSPAPAPSQASPPASIPQAAREVWKVTAPGSKELN